MKLPDSFLYEFNIEPGVWSNYAEFEASLLKFFKTFDFKVVRQTTTDGRRKLWVFKGDDPALPKAPQGKPVKK